MIKIVLSFLLISSFAQGRILTWQDCVDLLREKNTDLIAAQHSLSATKELEGVSKSRFFPQLSASLSETQSNTNLSSLTLTDQDRFSRSYSAQLNLSQNLFAGFSDMSKFHQAEANSKVAEASLQIMKAKLSADLKQAFQSVIYAEDFVRLAEEIQRRRKDNLRMVDLRFESGRENKGSALLSKAYFAQAQFDVLQAAHQADVTQDQLAFVLGLNRTEELRVSKTANESLQLINPSEVKINFSELIQTVPDYIQLKYKEIAAKEDVFVNRANFYPSLDLNGSYGKSDTTFFPNSDRWSATLVLTIPLFNGGRDWAASRSASETAAAASSYLKGANLQILVKLKTAYQNYLEAVEKEKVDESFRSAQEVRANIARDKYNNGLMTFDDWDVVENDLISREKASLQSHRDRVIQESTWEQVQGIGVL
jgi:outer membrane protein